MNCRICGASCRCKGARGGICCSCHPHKGRTAQQRLLEMQQRRIWRAANPEVREQMELGDVLIDERRP